MNAIFGVHGTVFNELVRDTFREAMPIHYIFKIESFSQLSNTSNTTVKLESNVFETGGYKWKLSLYQPGGGLFSNGPGYISLYLELVDTSLTDCRELNVLFRLFLFDHIRHRYFIRGGNPFPEMKKVWGFDRFISIANFAEPANGFLVGDTCVFGAEVFVTKLPVKIECLSMEKKVTTVTHTWKIENFSNIKVECLHSDMFKAGGLNWDLIIYPQGNSERKIKCVSLYLRLVYSEKEPGLQVYTNYKLRVRKQFGASDIEFSSVTWFCASSESSGCVELLSLDEMNNYLMKDACIVEAEVKVLGVSKRP